jgi:hypothetical protein
LNIDESAGYPEGYDRGFLVNAGLRVLAGVFAETGIPV